MAKTILVFGATGRQGSATIRHLLASGWQVRALTRDPEKPAAQALKQSSVEVVRGDTDDLASLQVAMQGVYGVFSMLATRLDDEASQGKHIADAAKAANVQHFVYSSVQFADKLAEVGGDASKWEIEQYIHALSLPATILRPPFFMDTLIGSRPNIPAHDADSTILIPAKAEVPIGLIAADDIGAFAALAFDHPDKFLGKTFEIAGDILTPPQVAEAISRAKGYPVTYVEIPVEALRQHDEKVARASEYLNASGYLVDLAVLRKLNPTLKTLDMWLRQ